MRRLLLTLCRQQNYHLGLKYEWKKSNVSWGSNSSIALFLKKWPNQAICFKVFISIFFSNLGATFSYLPKFGAIFILFIQNLQQIFSKNVNVNPILIVSQKYTSTKSMNHYIIYRNSTISWCGDFLKTNVFQTDFRNSRETMRKLCVSTKFSHQEIKWSFGILGSEFACLLLYSLYLRESYF